MNLHEMANYSANFRTNFFIFGIQVHNFVLKAQYKERGGNVEELLLAGKGSALTLVDLSGRNCGPIETFLKRVPGCVTDNLKQCEGR